MEQLRRLAYAVLQVGFDGAAPPGWLRAALSEGLGGVLLWNRAFSGVPRLTALTGALRAEHPGVLVAMAEGSDATGGPGAGLWPSNGALGVVDDTRTTRRVAAAMGGDLAAADIAMKFAPVADVNSTPRNPVIGVRSFGSRHDRVAAHTEAYVDGLQSRGVAACVKQFPGLGDPSVDSHRDLPVVHADAEALADPLLPFRAAIATGVKAVMTAHILLPEIDDAPATLSRTLLTGILRNELGYEGVIVTDALEMAALERAYGLEEAAVRAIAAGADTLFLGGWHEPWVTIARVRDALIDAVHAGRLAEQRLAEAAERTAALASWSQRTRHTGGPAADPAIGRAVARQAIRTVGVLTPLGSAPYVVELVPPEGAHGPGAAWDLGAALARRRPGTTVRRVTGPPDDPAALTEVAECRPMVIAVRDAHRHAWVRVTLDAMLGKRPDATVVEMGLPVGVVPACGAYLTTFGATAASSLAAADALT